MAVLSISAFFLNSRLLLSNGPHMNRSSVGYNGNSFAVNEVNSLPCSGMKTFGMLYGLSSSLIQHNPVLGCAFGKGTVIQHTTASIGRISHLMSFRPCQVKSEDSEGMVSGESIMLDEQTLERKLQIAVEEENYAEAAKIRDSLRFLHEDGKASVLAANARFYSSFRKGDLAAMQALWAKAENVCCVHPGVSGISGYDLVMGSWEFVWADYEFPLEIELKDVQVHVRGDLGYVTCVELVKTKGSSWGRQFATNVFEKIDGQWFICIHHASHVDL